MLSIIRQLHSFLDRILVALVVILMLITLSAMFMQVIDRYLIHSTIIAYDQIAKVSMIWLCSLGLPVVFIRNMNVTADLIEDLLPAKILHFRSIFFDLIITGMATTLLVFGLPVMEVGGFQDIIGVPLTYWSIYLAVNISMALLAIICSTRIITTLLERKETK